jgi:hypothetical protein
MRSNFLTRRAIELMSVILLEIYLEHLLDESLSSEGMKQVGQGCSDRECFANRYHRFDKRDTGSAIGIKYPSNVPHSFGRNIQRCHIGRLITKDPLILSAARTINSAHHVISADDGIILKLANLNFSKPL